MTLKAYIVALAVILLALVAAFGEFLPTGWSEGGF
jgi:hypothetical protein